LSCGSGKSAEFVVLEFVSSFLMELFQNRVWKVSFYILKENKCVLEAEIWQIKPWPWQHIAFVVEQKKEESASWQLDKEQV
jgi:hypothetical protein